MSEASIIQQLTLNQPLTFSTTTGIDRVKIHNDSSYYLRVYFGLGAPASANAGGWHDTISPGASPVIAVVGAARAVTGLDLTNSQNRGSYQGQVIVLPFLPVGAPSPTGVLTGAALCYLTGFYPDEYAETAGQVEAFIQAAKQGRYEFVPGASNSFVGVPFYTDETTADSTVMNGPMFQITSGGAPNLFAANAAGQSQIVMYLWAYECVMRCRTPAVARVNAWVQSVVTDSTLTTVKGSSGLIPLTLSAVNFGTDRFLLTPAYPMQMRAIIAQNALVSGDLMGFRYRTDTNAGHIPIGSFELAHTFSFYFDVINESVNYAIGIPNSLAAANAFPWNATYNPQTY